MFNRDAGLDWQYREEYLKNSLKLKCFVSRVVPHKFWYTTILNIDISTLRNLTKFFVVFSDDIYLFEISN